MKAISFFFDGDDILDADELKKMIKAAQKNPKFHLFEIARTDDEDGVDSHFVLAENFKKKHVGLRTLTLQMYGCKKTYRLFCCFWLHLLLCCAKYY